MKIRTESDHETKEKLIKKKLHVLFSAGQQKKIIYNMYLKILHSQIYI